MPAGKCIVVGVSGGIAAHRALDLTSTLVKAGAEVHVVVTAGAREFIKPLAFEAISGNYVHHDVFATPSGWRYPHLELARKADLAVIAPATADIIARLACGLADDLLTTTVLAMTCPLLVCPAMNLYMYRNPVVQENLDRLRRRDMIIVGPASGRQACGDEGPGRLVEVTEIVRQIKHLLEYRHDLAGLKVLVTAGGTREPIDPVRYISNRSSGKMGYALAEAAAARGARVYLVSAPVSLTPPEDVEMAHVETAEQMYRAVTDLYPEMDAVVKAAAVADYRPGDYQEQKIKKGGPLTLELEKTRDILAELGSLKSKQVLVGFAAETQDLVRNATNKLVQKNLDLLVANDVTQPGAGFGADTNIVKLLYPDGRMESLPVMDKLEISHRIWDEVIKIRQSKEEKP